MNKEVLRRPFPPDLIKQREGPDGRTLSYVETHSVITRLNEGCDAWDFEVVEHHVYKVEVVVVGKLTADGVTKMAFGGSAITFSNSGKAVSLADDLKAAASDALKKCASLLGVGLELYARKNGTPGPSNGTHPQGGDRPRSSPGAALGDALATEKQVSAIKGICRRKNISREQVAALVKERTGKQRVRELTRKQASALIGELSGLNGAHPEGAASPGP